MAENRSPRRVLVGTVISDKMEKTVTVEVERIVKHPKIGKMMKRFSRCYAHDEKREAHVGDLVEIMQTRPLSRLKRWRVQKILEKAPTEGVDAPTPA